MPTDKAFRWYGGKGQIAKKIIRLMPPHKTYVEGCAGSASILLGKEPTKVEVLNDMNSDLVNFYRVLRDKDQCQELIRLCELTPYSREEYEAVRTAIEGSKWPPHDNPVLQAWMWFVYQAQSYSPGHDRCTFGVKTVRDWAASVSKLSGICNRLQKTIIENGEWELVAQTYDAPDTLLYLDPPYMKDTRNDKGAHYKHEMNAFDHITLLRKLDTLESMIMISGGHHPVYDKFLVDERGWAVHEFTVNTISNKARVDVLWVSPNAVTTLNPKSSQLGFQIEEVIETESEVRTQDEEEFLEKMADLLGEDFAINYVGASS